MLSKILKNITRSKVTIFFLIIISTYLGFYPASTEEAFNRIGNIIEHVRMNTDFRVEQYVRLIKKTAKKIAINSPDLRRGDVNDCISYLSKIPESAKTEDVQAAIGIIVMWSAENP